MRAIVQGETFVVVMGVAAMVAVVVAVAVAVAIEA